ncbi:MAG: MBL fold metallo-hydrolase [Desulfobacterales bacterium]|nr:MBL fold metallo-hydrolase [Desulfobacterales bacterium]
MTERRDLNRRDFLRKTVNWSALAALFGYLPACMYRNGIATSSVKDPSISNIEHLSLRELAQRKIHHGEGRFLNPFTRAKHGNLGRLLRWKLFSENHFKSLYHEDQVHPVHIDWDPVREHKGCAVTFLKHASLMIKDLDQYLLVDPVFKGLFWFNDFTPLAFDLKKMPQPDHVLITHGHFDHLDPSSLSSLKRETHVITPLGYDGIFRDLKMSNRTQLDWFDTYRAGEREIVFLPCNHWTMRNPLVGPNDSLWGSFLIKCASGMNIFVSGDTAYFDCFAELGKEFPIDLAIFNLGAYEPRWFMAGSHINPSETAEAFLELKAKHLLIVHWGTFRLGDEPVHFPPLEMKREMEGRGMLDRLIHLDHGRTLFYDGSGGMKIL